MQKIILDTNVIISGLIQRNYPNFIIHHCIIEGLIELCVSDDLIFEYIDVLNRPKFSRYPDFISKAEYVMAMLIEKSRKYSPRKSFDVISDKDDNKILELAYEAKADFIITGNTNDFTLSEFKGTKIVSPKEYWDKYRELIL